MTHSVAGVQILDQVRPPTKEIFQIIPMHMMNREKIPGHEEDGLTVSSINCDSCLHLDQQHPGCLPQWCELNKI